MSLLQKLIKRRDELLVIKSNTTSIETLNDIDILVDFLNKRIKQAKNVWYNVW